MSAIITEGRKCPECGSPVVHVIERVDSYRPMTGEQSLKHPPKKTRVRFACAHCNKYFDPNQVV